MSVSCINCRFCHPMDDGVGNYCDCDLCEWGTYADDPICEEFEPREDEPSHHFDD